MDQRHAVRLNGAVAEFEVVVENFPIAGRSARKGRATFRARHDLNDGTLSLESAVTGSGTTPPAKIEIVLDATSRDALTHFLTSPPER